MIDEHNFEKYKDYWEKSRIVVRTVLAHNPKKVLDVGCGQGKVVCLLRQEGIEAYGIDTEKIATFAPSWCDVGNAKNIPFTDKFFDVVVSNDFFEHLKEDEIDIVYNEMKRVGNYVITRISLKQKDNHLTVKPISWWKEKLPGCEFIGKDWNK